MINDDFLNISEIFGPVLQGEGVSVGVPASFIRVFGCNLMCGGMDGSLFKSKSAGWHCDTESLWRSGINYSFDDIRKYFEMKRTNNNLSEWDYLVLGKSHFVLTGGEPTLTNNAIRLSRFIDYVYNESINRDHGFGSTVKNMPYFELETNGSCYSEKAIELINKVNQVNCSPKLSNSGMVKDARFNLDVLKVINRHPNGWFKFVISCSEDWHEISREYLDHIALEKVILMPACISLSELPKMQKLVWQIAVENHVRSTTRLQVLAWDQMSGV